MIIPVYKPLGASSHLLAKAIGDKHGEKATHTGTLDPMAEGILVVLTGDDRFKKSEFSGWKKEYEFEMLIGFETDSFDLLGIVTKTDDSKLKIKELKKTLPNFVGKQTQTVPKFSAQRVGGKSGFDLAKIGKSFKLQKNKIEIFSLEILGSRKLNGEKLLQNIETKINKVEGDFRQNEILKTWRRKLTQPKFITQNFTLVKIKTTTSKRTYIRALIRDLGKRLKTPMTAFSIVRTKNGKFKDEALTTFL